MEQVIKEYGQFLLSGITVVLVMLLLFTGLEDTQGNIGAFKMFGETIETIDINHDTYTDFKEIYWIESKKPFPVITYISGHLKTGAIKLEEHIKAVDYAGRELEIKITAIEGPDGKEKIGEYNDVTTEIVISNPGIYTVNVNAVDDGNRSSQCIIRIPVIR